MCSGDVSHGPWHGSGRYKASVPPCCPMAIEFDRLMATRAAFEVTVSWDSPTATIEHRFTNNCACKSDRGGAIKPRWQMFLYIGLRTYPLNSTS